MRGRVLGRCRNLRPRRCWPASQGCTTQLPAAAIGAQQSDSGRIPGGYSATTWLRGKRSQTISQRRLRGYRTGRSIMAYWQVGLGGQSHYEQFDEVGPEWANWPGFSKLWTQPCDMPGSGHFIRTATRNRVKVARPCCRLGGHLPFRGRHSDALRGSGFSSTASTAPPTGSRRRFQPALGTYLVSVWYGARGRAWGASRRIGCELFGQYRTLRDDSLAEIARTGGRVLDVNDAGTVFETARPFVRSPFWDDLVRQRWCCSFWTGKTRRVQ